MNNTEKKAILLGDAHRRIREYRHDRGHDVEMDRVPIEFVVELLEEFAGVANYAYSGTSLGADKDYRECSREALLNYIPGGRPGAMGADLHAVFDPVVVETFEEIIYSLDNAPSSHILGVLQNLLNRGRGWANSQPDAYADTCGAAEEKGCPEEDLQAGLGRHRSVQLDGGRAQQAWLNRQRSEQLYRQAGLARGQKAADPAPYPVEDVGSLLSEMDDRDRELPSDRTPLRKFLDEIRAKGSRR